MVRQPDVVTRKEDLTVKFGHEAGGAPDPRVQLVDERTGRVLLALPPDEAAMVGEGLYFLATKAAAAVAQIERGNRGDLR